MRRAALAAVLGATACAPAARPVAVPVADAPPPAPLAARWLTRGGATLVGPKVAGGVLALVGGRRAVVDARGGVQIEREPSPEPLREIIEVPGVAGSGVTLVARGERTLFRLPDPLGAPIPLARAASPLVRLGAAPGVVVAWSITDDLPRYVALSGGAAPAPPGAPAGPARALAFVDARRGAGIFFGLGLAVTTDGGATFRPATGADALRVRGLRRGPGGGLRAFEFSDGPDAEVDLDAAIVGDLRPAAPPSRAVAPLLQWIAATHRDPLDVAVEAGADLAGGVLVAAQGLAARVDPRSGLVTAAVEFARGPYLGTCGVARAGDGALLACATTEEGAGVEDPFAVLRASFDGGTLRLDKPILTRSGDAELRASSNGAVMLMRPCARDDDEDAACVKQPDGRFVTVKSARADASLDLEHRAVGPLASGAMAFLRGVGRGGDADDVDEGGVTRTGPRVVAIDAAGAERTILPLALDGMSARSVHPQSSIQQDAVGALHLALADDAGAAVVVAPPGGDAARPQRVKGARVARLHGARGVAVGDGVVLGSTDGGATWSTLDAPPAVLQEVTRLGPALEAPEAVIVGDIGARIGGALRIGWGPAPPLVSPPAVTTPELALPALVGGSLSTRGAATLVCTSSRSSTGAKRPAGWSTGAKRPAGWSTGANPPALRVASPPKDREHVAFAGVTPFEPAGVIERGGDAWTLRWVDPLEVGAREHRVRFAAPAAWAPQVLHASADGERILITLRVGAGPRDVVLVRAHGAAVEVRRVPRALAPVATHPADPAFGAEIGEPIVWATRGAIVAWTRGEAPRVVARVAETKTLLVAEPAADHVTLQAEGVGWSVSTDVPIAAAGEAVLPRWAPSRTSLLADVGRLRACPRGARGPRVRVSFAAGTAEIDGAREAASASMIVVRLGPEPCVASLMERLVPPAQKPNAGARLAPAFVRADFARRVAEVWDLGPNPDARPASCSLTSSSSPAP